MIEPRGALRRSLVVWGWGQIATGDRRGVLLAILEVAAISALAGGTPLLLAGTWFEALFVAGALVGMTWAAVALHAYQRAGRLRLAALGEGGTAGDGGGVELLWLAPIAIAAATAFWSLAGVQSSAQATMAAYAGDWRHDRSPGAVGLFERDVPAEALAAAWTRQGSRLRNELVSLAATLGPSSGIDPDQPFDSMRFELGDEGSAATGQADTRVAHVQVTRREAVADTFLGLVPTTAQRLVAVAELGTVTLRRVPDPAGPGARWTITAVDVLGERIGD